MDSGKTEMMSRPILLPLSGFLGDTPAKVVQGPGLVVFKFVGKHFCKVGRDVNLVTNALVCAVRHSFERRERLVLTSSNFFTTSLRSLGGSELKTCLGFLLISDNLFQGLGTLIFFSFVQSNKMTPKREAFVRCCEWIAKHFADQESSDEEECFTDHS